MNANSIRFLTFLAVFVCVRYPPVLAEFSHPGIAHSSESIEFVKTKINAGEQPWSAAWEKLLGSRYGSLDWKPHPYPHVERGPYNDPNIGSSEFSEDAKAAYNHALCWALSGEEAHANKAAEIIDAWSETLESIENHDAKLLIGMSGYHFCIAAEILKHSWDQWPQPKQAQFALMLRDIWYPVIQDFYPSANGNWDASMMQVIMAMGVFLDDQGMFDRAKTYFLSGEGNGAIGNYFKESGQCQETGRDQGHTQMGLEYLANTCETAWIQGVDLYGALDNRLLKGFEYTAKYNLGFDVPYEPYESFEGRYHYDKISSDDRGRLRPMYERVLNHYHNRKGLDAPYTKQAALKLRSNPPERRGRRGRRSSSHLDTLMYANPPSEPLTFHKQVLTDQYFCDGINSADFNRDGKPDIVAGPYWYEGPEFTIKHEFYPAKTFPREPSPSDSMFSYTWDFNGDTWPDILVLGRVHLHPAVWYENPQGKNELWKQHFAFERVQGESPPFLDVDGDGKPEIVALWEQRWGLIQPVWSDPQQPWRFRPITLPGDWQRFHHGTGIGDVNGDGRFDLILNDGWWSQPADSNEAWTAHPVVFSEDKGGAQMFAYDVNGDGLSDVITALNAHGWGLAWFEQVRNNGEISFQKHPFMGDRDDETKYGVCFSQPHALALCDLDGDGLQDMVVGKRMWAHPPPKDIEPNAPPVLYWFRLQREKTGEAKFVPHFIDDQSGVGVQVTSADVTGDGRPDILTVSKKGSFLFVNQQP
ncbi:FG-GAP-like repeat-containing protein [Novipirellula artificiosorum]|uniref:FG-GAP repeat protein n=1 Tax=Novipirellula artificiosorum TaxID=2528016 RepID=A0A5C6D698_9BACT|nr:FG-GAP-like repeat-containing protein [Novipirellula artificiosorum]TWU32452.1 FG-GAP repeat protein [Novipirellula artificiosorum]